MIIDGGSVGIGLESTIVDFTEDEPVILRPGYINQEMMEDVIGQVKVDRDCLLQMRMSGQGAGDEVPPYAPQASLTIVEGKAEGYHCIDQYTMPQS